MSNFSSTVHLPPSVRTALASSKATTNDQLADEANTMFLELKVGARSRARVVASVKGAPEEDGRFLGPRRGPRSKQGILFRPVNSSRLLSGTQEVGAGKPIHASGQSGA